MPQISMRMMMAREIRWLATAARRERAKERKTKEGWMSRGREKGGRKKPCGGLRMEGREEGDAVKMKFYCPLSRSFALSHCRRRAVLSPGRDPSNRSLGARTAATRLGHEKVSAGETKRLPPVPPLLLLHIASD